MATSQTLPLDSANIEAKDRLVRLWLVCVASLIFCMIVVGGATRLTGSGLSITEWQPIMGAVPPLNEADWQTAFEKYKQIPQYERINKGMALGEFKAIFVWEWGHRLLGRLIGFVFAVPLVWFWLRGSLRRESVMPLAGIFALGGLQGAVGWYMVSSGLVDRVSVSQYRLALHLTIAFLILAAVIWHWLLLMPERVRVTGVVPENAKMIAWVLMGLVTLQVVAGALVAGMKAGLAYNTWPTMDGEWVPNGLFIMKPWWINAFENALTVQFDHRMLAYVILALAAWQSWRMSRVSPEGDPARSAQVLLAVLLLQATVGIATLLGAVPLSLGLLHQGGAAMVYVAAVWHVFTITHLSGTHLSAAKAPA